MQSFGALADPTRRKIVDALATRPLSVNEVVEMFPISQPSVSRHLQILRRAGLVSVDQQGRRRVYQLDSGPLREIDDWLERYRHFWADRLDALERHIDE